MVVPDGLFRFLISAAAYAITRQAFLRYLFGGVQLLGENIIRRCYGVFGCANVVLTPSKCYGGRVCILVLSVSSYWVYPNYWKSHNIAWGISQIKQIILD